jgi:hypothetical protein
MSADIQNVLDEVRELRDEQRATRDLVIELNATLKQRCPNNERRLGELERKCRNGNGASPTGIAALGLKTILALVGVIATLATIVSTLISHLLGAH